MAQKNIIQKLVTFESKSKDFASINKDLSDGWYISSLSPHKKNLYLCVLEKNLSSTNKSSPSLSLKDILNIAHPRKNKYNITIDSSAQSDKSISKVLNDEHKILEDA
ncbi:MAG: DUF2674 domain-containing protein [Alphaproteobacteria bacterium]